MRLLVGCPVRDRNWILQSWFDHVLCLGRGVVRAVSGGERIVEFLAQSVPVGLCVGVGDGTIDFVPLRGRTVTSFSIGSGFMFTYPYPTYSQLATFPSPRMECMFHPGEL